ncbi:MAG: TroA family protein [Planctomycetota bacterium]|jgi:ABC-type Fe3+-hydroxamate transport system substrate-binding protein
MRVVSLLPSATESLCAIGGASLLVGRSHECDHPASIAHLPVLTSQRTVPTNAADIDRQVRETLEASDAASLYELDTDLLRELRPDVILTQDLCEVCSIDLRTVRGIAETLDPRPLIVSLDPTCIEDVFEDLIRVGEAVGLDSEAVDAVVALRESYWSAVDFVNPYVDGPEVAFLEWMDPLFVGGHWTPQLIAAAGGRHSLNEPGARSRRVTPAMLVAAAPERLIICPCGYDLEAIRRELGGLQEAGWWRSLPAVERDRVVLVDGN